MAEDDWRGAGSKEPAVKFEKTEIESILADLHRLRAAVINAWQDSAVMLVKEERQRLREEIRTTCEVLTAITAE